MVFIDTLMNVDQIYSYLLKINLSLIAILTLSMAVKINVFTLSKNI